LIALYTRIIRVCSGYVHDDHSFVSYYVEWNYAAVVVES
jgi:hypothetical protein